MNQMTDSLSLWTDAAGAARTYHEQACARSSERENLDAPDLEQMLARYRALYEYGEELTPDDHFPDVDSLVAAIDEEWTAERSVEECIRQRLDELRRTRRIVLVGV